MSWWDTVAGYVDDIGSWFGKNEDWIKPLANTGLQMYQSNNRADARSDYIDELRRQEEEKWRQGKERYDAVVGANGQESGGGGGSYGGGGGGKNSQANAMNRARKRLKKGYNKASNLLKPYQEAGIAALPLMNANYAGASKGLSDLFGQMLTPENLQNINQPPPSAQAIDFGLSKYFGGK